MPQYCLPVHPRFSLCQFFLLISYLPVPFDDCHSWDIGPDLSPLYQMWSASKGSHGLIIFHVVQNAYFLKCDPWLLSFLASKSSSILANFNLVRNYNSLGSLICFACLKKKNFQNNISSYAILLALVFCKTYSLHFVLCIFYLNISTYENFEPLFWSYNNSSFRLGLSAALKAEPLHLRQAVSESTRQFSKV